jgi:23S rRNA pseudouridine1911/1915/1917 synthase
MGVEEDVEAVEAIEAVRTLEVAAGAAGTRLEQFVREAFSGSSAAEVRRIIADGRVRVDGLPGAKGYRLRAGQRIEVSGMPAASDWTPAPSAVPGVAVVFEDASLVVISKPSGVPSVPLRPEEIGTAANALLAIDPAMRGLGRNPRDSGLISRLDTGTSGLLAAGRTKAAVEALVEAAGHGRIVKGYLALVEGVRTGPWPRAIRRKLVVHGPRGSRVVAGPEMAPSAAGVPETRILRVRAGRGASLVVAEIRRGERHQIRAHLAAIGHPILGDVERGGRPLPGGGLALHAAWIELPHPRTGKPLRIETPPLEPLAGALREAELRVRRREGP